MAYLVIMGAGLLALPALMWAVGGLRFRSRYVGCSVAMYAIISLLLVALR